MPTRKKRTRKLAKALYKSYGVSFVLAHKVAKAWMQASNNWEAILNQLQKEIGLKPYDSEWFDEEDGLCNTIYTCKGSSNWISICGTNVPLPQNFFDPKDPEYTLIWRG